MPKPSKKLIEETLGMMRLKFFPEEEVGLKKDLSMRELKAAVAALKTKKSV